MSVGEKCGASTGPAHLLGEERPGCRGADTGGEAERDVADFPASIDSTKTAKEECQSRVLQAYSF